jgi:hypothetical protein
VHKHVHAQYDFSNFGSLKSTETHANGSPRDAAAGFDFSNFGSLKSTETLNRIHRDRDRTDFSNFGSLKSTETA